MWKQNEEREKKSKNGNITTMRLNIEITEDTDSFDWSSERFC